jgi:hypothetical protein
VVEQSQCSKLELIVYDSYLGITDHVNRVQRRLLPKHPNAIWVEEDFYLNFAGYSEFLNGLPIPDAPFLACANGQADHREVNVPLRTLFPPYWGQVVTMNLTEEIEKIRKDKKIDQGVAREMLLIFQDKFSPPKSYLFKRTVDYWNNYFNWGVHSPNRWDALATYVLWKSGNPTHVSSRNFVKDYANDDKRGMNKRHEQEFTMVHKPQIAEITQISICFLCEKKKSRSAFSANELVQNKFRYHKRIRLEKKLKQN